MPNVVQIPNQVSLRALGRFVRECGFFSWGESPESALVFHPGFVYLQPFGLAMLAAWAEHCAASQRTVRAENLKALSSGYAERMGLFKFLGISAESPRVSHEPTGRFVPITRIITGDDLERFLVDLVPLLHLPKAESNAVRYCLSETARNVLEHAGPIASAYACAQYYEKAKRVSIGVADTGRGIRASLATRYAFTDDETALMEAMKPGISGAPRGVQENAGAGLFFTRSIAKFSGGYFMLMSGGACYRLRERLKGETVVLNADPARDRHDLWTGLPGWRGTVVAVDVHLDRVKEFDVLLARIRDAYFGGRRQARDIVRKVRFV